MAQSTIPFIVLDGTGATKNFQAEQDITSGFLTPHHVIETGDAPVSQTNPLPIRAWDGVTLTQTVVTVPANQVDTVLIAANPNRRSLVLVNIDLGPLTLNFGAAASYGSGFPLDPAAIAGGTGGTMTWHALPPTNAVHAIAGTIATRVVVLEGV